MRLSVISRPAHPTQGNGPYACIMREFYFDTPKHKRPHIFGMTASPVNVRGRTALASDVAALVTELEAVMDATVVTPTTR